MKNIDIILASKSPQRKLILDKLELNFRVSIPNINEKIIIKEHNNSKTICKELAYLKAKKISLQFPYSLVIGADTAIEFKDIIIGKPTNKRDAFNTLCKLSGNKHIVHTSVSVILKSKNINEMITDKTEVTFNTLNEDDIKYYIKSYNPLERAGSYGIQEWSSVFVKKINGCYYNVVGFPLPKFYILFNKIKKLL